MGKVGSLEAVRDWVNRYYYKKSEINKFFAKLNTSGLKAYGLTFIADEGDEIYMIEDALSDTQSYTIEIPACGEYTSLFFFHSGSTLSISVNDGVPSAYILDEYIDTIDLT